jgi:hypothetical protein
LNDKDELRVSDIWPQYVEIKKRILGVAKDEIVKNVTDGIEEQNREPGK